MSIPPPSSEARAFALAFVFFGFVFSDPSGPGPAIGFLLAFWCLSDDISHTMRGNNGTNRADNGLRRTVSIRLEEGADQADRACADRVGLFPGLQRSGATVSGSETDYLRRSYATYLITDEKVRELERVSSMEEARAYCLRRARAERGDRYLIFGQS